MGSCAGIDTKAKGEGDHPFPAPTDALGEAVLEITNQGPPIEPDVEQAGRQEDQGEPDMDVDPVVFGQGEDLPVGPIGDAAGWGQEEDGAADDKQEESDRHQDGHEGSATKGRRTVFHR